MHGFNIALVCSGAMLVIGCSAHAEASYSETVRLVRSMRADELVLAALHGSLLENGTTAKWTSSQASCLSQIKYPLVTDALALELAPQLSDSEVAESIAFFRSEAGRKFTQQTYDDLKKNLDADTARTLDDAQRREFLKFSKRSAGRKLIEQNVLKQQGVVEKVGIRIRMAIDDCEFDAAGGEGSLSHGRSWQSTPVRGPDFECSATKQFVEFSSPGSVVTRIAIECPRSRHVVAEYKGRLKDVGFAWRDATTLEVIQPAGARVETSKSERRFKASFRQRVASDPPAPRCWPDPSRNTAAHVELDGLASQPFWMSYADSERCLLTKRVPQERGVDPRTNGVVQFQRHSTPLYPYGTTQLVLFETASGSTAKSVVVKGGGLDVPLVGGETGFYVTGDIAEKVLRTISRTPMQLEIQPATGSVYRVDVDSSDLDWALPPFEQCLKNIRSEPS